MQLMQFNMMLLLLNNAVYYFLIFQAGIRIYSFIHFKFYYGTSVSDFEAWINAVRALVILSIVTEAIGIVLLLFYIRREDGHANLNRIRTVLLLCVLAGNSDTSFDRTSFAHS